MSFLRKLILEQMNEKMNIYMNEKHFLNNPDFLEFTLPSVGRVSDVERIIVSFSS